MSSSILRAVFHAPRQQNGLQPKLYEASGNAIIDVTGLDFQLSSSVEEEKQTGE